MFIHVLWRFIPSSLHDFMFNIHPAHVLCLPFKHEFHAHLRHITHRQGCLILVKIRSDRQKMGHILDVLRSLLLHLACSAKKYWKHSFFNEWASFWKQTTEHYDEKNSYASSPVLFFFNLRGYIGQRFATVYHGITYRKFSNLRRCIELIDGQ